MRHTFLKIRPIYGRCLVAVLLITFAYGGARLHSYLHASTPVASVEAENGTLSGGTVKQTDVSASNGAAVIFKAATPVTGQAVRYMPLGDSITDGFGLPGSYRTVLWQKLVQEDHDNIDFVGSLSNGPATLGDKDEEGHSGWCIDGECGSGGSIYASIGGWLTTYNPDIISIHLGTNDIDWSGNAAIVTNRLDLLLARIYQYEPKSYIVLIQNIYMNFNPQVHDAYVASMPGLVSKYKAEGYKINLVNMSNLLTYPTDYRDSLHPTQAGFDMMGAALYPAVSAAYKSF